MPFYQSLYQFSLVQRLGSAVQPAKAVEEDKLDASASLRCSGGRRRRLCSQKRAMEEDLCGRMGPPLLAVGSGPSLDPERVQLWGGDRIATSR